MDMDAIYTFMTLDAHCQRELCKLVPLMKLKKIAMEISPYSLPSSGNFQGGHHMADFTLYSSPDKDDEKDEKAREWAYNETNRLFRVTPIEILLNILDERERGFYYNSLKLDNEHNTHSFSRGNFERLFYYHKQRNLEIYYGEDPEERKKTRDEANKIVRNIFYNYEDEEDDSCSSVPTKKV